MTLTITTLADQITQVHERTQTAAVQQVNYWLTIRNWLVGWYVIEYEQQGNDRATYGERLLGELARTLRQRGVSGLEHEDNHLCPPLV